MQPRKINKMISWKWKLGAEESAAMMLLTMISTLVGAVFGLRFKVLIILPAIGCALPIIFGIGLIRGDDAWSILLAMVLATTALQLGYLFGAVTRFFMVWVRFSRRSPVPTAAGQRLAR
jgi:hypothetical protein